MCSPGELAISRQTVVCYLKAGCFPEIAKPRKRPTILDRFAPYLRRRLVEGQVNRLKLVKRTMYGRANFDLLRQRVLAV